MAGLTLGSTAPRLFRALVEATAFGSRAIMERFEREGVRAERVVALGGIAQKSPFVMQVTADVLERAHPGGGLRAGLRPGRGHVRGRGRRAVRRT